MLRIMSFDNPIQPVFRVPRDTTKPLRQARDYTCLAAENDTLACLVSMSKV